MDKLKGAGHTVKCPKCKRVGVYVTTDKYDPDVKPNGSMVELIKPSHRGGYVFGSVRTNTANIGPMFMECCDCGGLLCKGGKLWVLPADYKPENQLTREEKNQRAIDAEFAPDKVFLDCESTMHIYKGEVVEQMPVEDIEDELRCPDCGKLCKTKGGLAGHMRHCKG